jgi:hypothetical protein
VALPREPVTVAQLAERLGFVAQSGDLIITRKTVHRLARAAWIAERRGLLLSEDARGAAGSNPGAPLADPAFAAEGRAGISTSPRDKADPLRQAAKG